MNLLLYGFRKLFESCRLILHRQADIQTHAILKHCHARHFVGGNQVSSCMVTGERQANTDDARNTEIERPPDGCATTKRLTSLPPAVCLAAAFPVLVGFCMTVIGGRPMSRRQTRRHSASSLYRACRRPGRCSLTRILCVRRTVISIARHITPPDTNRRHTVCCFRSIAGTPPTPTIRAKALVQSRAVPAATRRLPPPTSATATVLGPMSPTSIDRRACRHHRRVAEVQ